MPELPSGTVTFLFTDIERSIQLWERDRDAMAGAVARHIDLLDAAIQAHGGVHFKTVGDAVQAAFPTAPGALAAALEGQRALLAEKWPEGGPLRVRMALHAGDAVPDDKSDYLAPILNRLDRLLTAGHGGQVLLSQAVQQLARSAVPEGSTLRDHGEHRLRDLLEPERIFQLVHPDLPDAFPPLRTLEARPNNLPRQPTLFLGREREVDEVAALLRRPEVQLLTLTGTGGTGKTRLALQAAAELLDDFADGVFFVPLAALTDPALVPSAVASVLGIREEGGRPVADAVRDVLKDQQLLLLLDNCEHLLDAASVVGAWLTACAGLRVLATSRAPLRLQAEHEYPVPPLGLPRRKPPPTPEQLSQSEAVRLFITRAQAVRPGFVVDNENAPAIAEICWLLDGLPLAIELAAARVRMLPPEALLTRLGKRLPMLTGGARDLPARQRTLRDTIAWSHDLLDPNEQTFFRRLAVFVGGFTLEAAEAVANEGETLDVLGGVERLCEHSLLRQEGIEDEPRFQMLETVREYASERLAASKEDETVRNAHADFFVNLAEAALPNLSGPKEGHWSDMLEAEQDNLRAALAKAGESAPELLCRLVIALSQFWGNRGYLAEARDWAERALAVRGAVPTLMRANLLRAAATIAFEQGDFQASNQFATEGLPLFREAGDQEGISTSLNTLSALALFQGDMARATTLAEEALATARELGDPRTIAHALDLLADILMTGEDEQRVVALYREALAINRTLGNQRAIGFVLSRLGQMAELRDDLDEAESLHRESLTIHQGLGHRRRTVVPLWGLAQIAFRRGDLEAAEALHREAVEVARAVGDRHSLAASLAEIARVVLERGEPTRAEEPAAESLALARTMSPDRWVLRFILATSAMIAEERRDITRAAGLHAEALTVATELAEEPMAAQHLEGIARVAISAAEAERAVRLLGAADAVWDAHPTHTNWWRKTPREQERQDRAVASAQTALGEQRFAVGIQAGKMLSIHAAVAEAQALAAELGSEAR